MRTTASSRPGAGLRAGAGRVGRAGALLRRLGGVVVGYQRWDRILFLHWPVPAEALRPVVDGRLGLELHEGRAYLSLTPFTVVGARVRGLPRLPGLSTFHEVNLRTYVRAPDGIPGVWFFSLDAASAAASALARLGLNLPYRSARIERSERGGRHEYRSERDVGGEREALVAASWTVGPPLADPPGSLEHLLVERYALYSVLAGRLVRVRVRHRPWPLQACRVERLDETVSRAAGLPSSTDEPLAQFSTGVDVELFPPELVRP